MVTIAKATIIENIHQTFYTLLNGITGFTGKIYPAYPDLSLDAESTKSSYPIFILNSPDVDSWENFTLSKLKVSGTISVDVFTTSAKTADEYTSDVIDKIETSVANLRNDGLVFIKLSSMGKDQFQRGKLMIHNKNLGFSFEFRFDRSSLPW